MPTPREIIDEAVALFESRSTSSGDPPVIIVIAGKTADRTDFLWRLFMDAAGEKYERWFVWNRKDSATLFGPDGIRFVRVHGDLAALRGRKYNFFVTSEHASERWDAMIYELDTILSLMRKGGRMIVLYESDYSPPVEAK